MKQFILLVIDRKPKRWTLQLGCFVSNQ
jgi:hypothetical protein